MSACACGICGTFTQRDLCVKCEMKALIGRIETERLDPETYGTMAQRISYSLTVEEVLGAD